MKATFMIYLLVVLHCLKIFLPVNGHEQCENNVCLKDDYTNSTSTVEISTENEQIINMFNNGDTVNNIESKYIEIKSEKKGKLDKSFTEISTIRSTFDLLQYVENVTNSDIINETSSKVSSKDIEVKNTTTTIDVTEKSITSTSILNISTTPNPPLEFQFQNYSKDEICFCDMTLYQCDINCCCDKDCASAHFKVFTKCNNAFIIKDNNYCFKNNFIYLNNTNYKMKKDEGGLFCVVKDNSRFKLNFKTKPIITSLKAFNKSLPKNFYSFSPKDFNKPEFKVQDYQAGLPIWTVYNDEIKPFEIPTSSVGFLCSSQVIIKYLMDKTTQCSNQSPQDETACGNSKLENIFQFLRDMKIISNPGSINKTQKIDAKKICQSTSCISAVCYLCKSSSDSSCIKIPEKIPLLKLGCRNVIPKIHYHIWHNGTDGIKKFEAFIWPKNLSGEIGKHVLQTTKVKFLWIESSEKVFKRSGNPGYLVGKPVLAGKKINRLINGTVDKKEAIELSADPSDWLSVFGTQKGLCSSTKRIPINFKENVHYMCSLQLTKDNFGKDKCLELQNSIFKLIIGNDLVNATTDNYFNKYVATFGNSKVEETGDWVQVLIDLFPVISSQVGFKFNYNNLICKNIICDLFIDIVYANIGSFMNPQSKILGVSYNFGKHKDLTFHCDTPGCVNTTVVQYFKLSTAVQFIDVTEPAFDAFAEPLRLETKLPHDFFYPFFSNSCSSHCISTFILINILLINVTLL